MDEVCAFTEFLEKYIFSMRKERLQQIEEFINSKGFVTMEEIREEFSIAMPTVRKDISELANQKLIEKVYGGAKSIVKPAGRMHIFKNREVVNVAEKNEIAHKAAKIIKDGDVIYIDSGTTAANIIKHIVGKHVTVITSNLAAVNAISEAEDVEVYVLGGKLNKDTMSVDTSSACKQISRFNIDKAFMAATGYSIEGGIAQDSPTECEFKKYVLTVATECCLIIDSSKIGKKALVRYANAEDIKTIITNGRIKKEYEEFFGNNNINII